MPDDNETTAQQTARELGGINAKLDNIDKSLTELRDEMPCRSPDPRINPSSRLARIETRQDEMKKRMGIVEKIGMSIVAVALAVAAWFKTDAGGSP